MPRLGGGRRRTRWHPVGTRSRRWQRPDADHRVAGDERDEGSSSRSSGTNLVVRGWATGLNAANLQQVRGERSAAPGWPADVPGLEVAGEVEQRRPLGRGD
ncbi:hypothetical protein CFP66_44765 [Pseudonocardia sp. MH-G8]|nr:hypothetical protein CFP66_44765 [Pseudonocardia sp. MH-G8]